ncbi:MAG: translation initiation factor IF-3 [Actinobacteria bacterium]|nr:translation initiation factor IF-3 [Actinomycetota bacterium]MCL5446143.1 translation initiation factor IF-3 [Actinomycetota bacterium]
MRQVRLVGADGKQLGIKSTAEAMSMARRYDLDLVEVAPLADPPVCRLMDYGKYKFDTEQKARETKRKGSSTILKEMKYRPKIGSGDFDTKTRQVEKFLLEGHKVKVTIMFRGREVVYPELGKKILDGVLERVASIGKVENEAKLDGKNMVMILAPDRQRKHASNSVEGDAGIAEVEDTARSNGKRLQVGEAVTAGGGTQVKDDGRQVGGVGDVEISLGL